MLIFFNELVLGFLSSRKTLTLYDVAVGLYIKEWAIDKKRRRKYQNQGMRGTHNIWSHVHFDPPSSVPKDRHPHFIQLLAFSFT